MAKAKRDKWAKARSGGRQTRAPRALRRIDRSGDGSGGSRRAGQAQGHRPRLRRARDDQPGRVTDAEIVPLASPVGLFGSSPVATPSAVS